MKYRNRALALLLSMVMVLTFMPAIAFADAEDEAQAPANEAAAEVETPAEAEAPADVEEPAEAEAPAEAEKPAEAEAPADVEEAAAKEPKAAPAKAPETEAGTRGEQTYTLTFDPNGGYYEEYDDDYNCSYNYSSVTQEYEGGEVWIDADTPLREGYRFLGWAKSENSSDIIDFDAEQYNVTANETFYAQWSENPKVTLDLNGGYFVYYDDNNKPVKVYDTYTLTTSYLWDDQYEVDFHYEPKRVGYEFEGWLCDDGSTVYDLNDYTITEAATFTAQWARNDEQFIVTFNAVDGTFDDGSHTKEIAVWQNDGEAWLDSDYYYEPSKAGYVLSYWTDPSGKTFDDDDFEEGFYIKKDTTFTAHYETAFKLTFKPDKDDDSKKFVNNDGEVLSEYVTYVRKSSYLGMTPDFYSEDGTESVIGWTDKNGNTAEEGEYKITADTVLYAVWGKRVKVILHGNGGLFDNEEETREDLISENSSFEYAADFTEGGIQIAPINKTQPHLEGSIFTGWYTDEACNNLFTQKEATEEYISTLENNNYTLDLYAGFTQDYSTVTIYADGGYFLNPPEDDEYADVNPMKLVDGTAINLGQEVNKQNEYGENLRVAHVYSDAEHTSEVELTADGYYVVNGDADLYIEWGEELPEVDLDLDGEFSDFYLDGNLELYADVDYYDDEKMNKSAIIKVYDTTNGGGDLDTLTPITVLTDSKYIAWEDDTITLYGPEIEKALKGLSVDMENITLGVYAEISAKTGESLATDDYIAFPKVAYYDYKFEDVFEDYNEELEKTFPAKDNKFEILLGGGKYIDFTQGGVQYSSEYPEGSWFNYKITGITSSKTGVVKVLKSEDGYELVPVSLGTANIKVSYYNKNIKAQDTVTYTATVVNSKYYVWFEGKAHNDDDDEMFVLRAVPGGSAVFKAKGSRVDVNGAHTDGITYNWSFVDEEAGDFATISADGSSATVTVNENVDLDNEALREGIKVKVEVVADEDGQVKASETALLRIVSEYYEIANLPEVDPWMRRGETVEFNPEVRHFSPETRTLPGGYEVSSKPVTLSFPEDREDFDPVQSIKITANGEEVHSGTEVSGAFTLERTADPYTYLELIVNTGSSDDDEDDEDYGAGYCIIDLDDILNMKYVKVGGIKAQTYTGKARKPVPTYVYGTTVRFDEIDADRSEGDYTISYKNNTKVGKASITLTGHNRFYGTKTIYFDINPKKAVISGATPGKGKLTVKAKTKVSSTGGTTYQIWYKAKGSSSWKKKSTTKQTYVIKSLKKGKKYYVKIRAIKKVGSKIYYGSWSTTKTTGKIK